MFKPGEVLVCVAKAWKGRVKGPKYGQRVELTAVLHQKGLVGLAFKDFGNTLFSSNFFVRPHQFDLTEEIAKSINNTYIQEGVDRTVNAK